MANRASTEEKIIQFFTEHQRDDVGTTVFNIIRGIMRKPTVAKRSPGRPRKTVFVQAETPEV
jgi:Tfp pilus assembly pilus retraction ATPase PilT